MSKILLSICIPTNGRIEILNNTLDSIFLQAKDFSEFEVILSDNSTSDDMSVLLNKFKDIPNIVYKKTESSGFMNSINALSMGSGELLKLHNNYTELKIGSLDIIIKTIKENLANKPLLFFSSLSLKQKSIEEYDNFDEFMCSLSFYSSWSTGFSIWKSDFIKYSNIDYNKMFPHTSLLLEQNKKKLYIINNEDLFSNQNTPTKGGYNLFRTFCVDYLNMLNDSFNNGNISHSTFNHIKEHMYLSFLVPWYYQTKISRNNFTYDLTGIKSSLEIYYPKYYYYLMVAKAWTLYPLKLFFVKYVRHIETKFRTKSRLKN